MEALRLALSRTDVDAGFYVKFKVLVTHGNLERDVGDQHWHAACRFPRVVAARQKNHDLMTDEHP